MEEVDRAVAQNVVFDWLTFDEEYGKAAEFVIGLDDRSGGRAVAGTVWTRLVIPRGGIGPFGSPGESVAARGEGGIRPGVAVMTNTDLSNVRHSAVQLSPALAAVLALWTIGMILARRCGFDQGVSVAAWYSACPELA